MAAKTALFLTAALAAAPGVLSHAIVTSVWVNGEDTADGSTGVASSYMRVPSSNSPVQDLTSANLACNDRGTTSVSGTLTVAAGDTIEPEWYHSGERGADPIDPSHKGPLTTWISPLDANTEGNVWVEIASEAYYSDSDEWAVTKMIANKGRNTVKIPETLAPGDYLIRFDLLALHSAESAGGAQFYPNCAQVTVTGSGSQELPAGVAIPGFFTEDTPGVVWNIYYSTDYDITGDYVAPGTGVWDGSATYLTDACTETVDGLAPAGYCQSGSSSGGGSSTSKAASTTSAAATSSAAATTAGSSSAAASSSTAAGSSSGAATSAASSAVESTTKAGTTTTRAASSTAAASSSSAAAPSSSSGTGTYTDYNSCMRAYNKCLDAAQPVSGGAADFSSCASFNCASLPATRMARRSVRERAYHQRERMAAVARRRY